MTHLPSFIARSVFREDLAKKREAEGRGSHWLYPPKQPIGGQELLFQVDFAQPMKVAATGEASAWCMMAGRVRTVLSNSGFIARVGANPHQAPEALTGSWDAGFAFDTASGNWVLQSLAPKDPKDPSPTKLPPFVREGYNRDDACRENEASSGGTRSGFHEGQQPQVGQRVKVQLQFNRELPSAAGGEPSTWCLLGGTVEQVVDEEEVRISVEPTSDNAPRELEGRWKGTLVYDPRRDLPWVLTRLEKA
jgi:hypothetical protein